MTENEYREIDEALDTSEESVVPFPVPTDDELIVAGDANRTEINRHDFTVVFSVPKGDKYETVTREFKDVYITPRQAPTIQKAVTALLPFFRKANTDGTVTEYTEAEKVEIAKKFDQSIWDSMYQVVGVVLRIDPAVVDYMTPNSVLKALVKIIMQYPEMINEADTFFA